MSPEEIQQLYDYNAWANHRALGAAETLSSEQFIQPVASSFSCVRDTLAHICGAEWIWLERFQGRSPSSLPDLAGFQDVPSLRAHWLPQEQRLLEFVRGLTQVELEREFEYKTLTFGVTRNPLWQPLLHLINHGTYHRGQVTSLMRQLGAEPASTDLIYFYRERSLGKGA
jgi:uncharacterized damage-inducible protein DinB